MLAVSATAISTMVLLGTAGNIAVIYGMGRFGRASSPYFFIITMMAGIDLLVCLVDVPIYAVFTLNAFQWPLPGLLCKPYLILDYLLCSMSSYCVAILSFDRCVLVFEPLRYQKLQTRRKILCILTGAFMLANFHTPLILLWPEAANATEPDAATCAVQYEEHLGIQLGGVLVQFFLPFAATVISSGLVYHRMTRRKRLFFNVQDGLAQFARHNSMIRQANKASRKAGRWLILFDSIYTTMWLPCMAMVLLRCAVSANLFSPGRPLFHLFQVCWWLLLCNSAVNPFLYIQSCDPVCNFYLRRFCCCCPCARGRSDMRSRRTSSVMYQQHQLRHNLSLSFQPTREQPPIPRCNSFNYTATRSETPTTALASNLTNADVKDQQCQLSETPFLIGRSTTYNSCNSRTLLLVASAGAGEFRRPNAAIGSNKDDSCVGPE